MRIEWVDIAKGIGIILVVFGHIKYIYCDEIYLVIKQFHMPLFFISGYFIKICNINLKSEIYKKIKTLYVPFVVINVLFVVLHNFL